MSEQLAAELRRLIGGPVLAEEPLARYTTWRIGGPAELLVIPQTAGELLESREFSRRKGLPFTILGNGSNVLVSDAGVRGVVARTVGGLKGVRWEGETVRAQAGVLLVALARAAARRGLAGLEFAAGIPASVGGAAVMNAGAEGSSFGELLRRVWLLDPEGRTEERRASELGYGYRSSGLRGSGLVVLEVEAGLCPADPREISLRMRSLLSRRRARQPLNQPSAGSVFINPPGWAAGFLIEQAGCKGLRRGQALVSPRHANFIVNLGGASAADVLALAEEVRERVYRRTGVSLQLEVRLLGEGLADRG